MAMGNELENPQWNVHCAGETRKLHYTRLNTNLQIFFFLTQTHTYYIVIFFFFSSPNSVFHDARVSLSLSLGGNSHKCTPTIINPAYLLSIHPLNPNFTYSSKKRSKCFLRYPMELSIFYIFFNHSTSYSSEKELTPYVQLSPVFFFHSLSFQPIRCRVPSTSSDHGDYKREKKKKKKRCPYCN